MSQPMLTPAEIAEHCRLSTKTVLRAIRSGRLRACRLGTRGGYRVAAEDLEAWIATSMVEPEKRAWSSRTPLPIASPAPSAMGRLVVGPGMGANRREEAVANLGQGV